MTTTEGPTNNNSTTANLVVNAVGVSKAFAFPSFQAGSTNTLTITLTNYSGSNYTVASISDNLPTTPNSNLRFTGTPRHYLRFGGAVDSFPNSRTVRLTGGIIPASSNCTITVTVTTDVAAPAASYTGGNWEYHPGRRSDYLEGPTNQVAATAPVQCTPTEPG